MLTNTPVAPTVASMGLQPKQTTPTRSTQPSKPSSQETLPSYPEATDGCVVTVAEEKAAAQEAYAKSTAPKGSGGKMATLKSILSGGVQRHHPMYALERAVVPDESRSGPSQSRT